MPSTSARKSTAASKSADAGKSRQPVNQQIDQTIKVQGARTHNLANIDCDIPRNKLVVVTGLSGSGKSSLAFDTIYAEGQRRYVESLSSYARQFLGRVDPPAVDHIAGLSPAIAIEQKSTSRNPRSTVGTVTEIYDYLRLLFARVGEPRCPTHGTPLRASSTDEIVDDLLKRQDERLLLMAPIARAQKGTHRNNFDVLRQQGIVRVRINGTVHLLEEVPELNKNQRHDLDAVIDRLRIRNDDADLRVRIVESLDVALKLGQGRVVVAPMQKAAPEQAPAEQAPAESTSGEDDADDAPVERLYSTQHSCPQCGYAMAEMEPRIFSFNSPHGACAECEGLGRQRYVDPERLVIEPGVSIADGALRVISSKTTYHYKLLDNVAKHYQFDLKTPWHKMPESTQSIVLAGTNETLDFVYRARRVWRWKRAWKGLLHDIDQRYRKTESESVRAELNQCMSYRACSTCGGARLSEPARHVFVDEKNLSQICNWPIQDAFTYFSQLQLPGAQGEIAGRILYEITSRLRFLKEVGLGYLSLSRNAESLSGGEAQRIRLATQIGTGLVGVLYVLDEPSIGLHQRDNKMLLGTLCRLRDLGNTVLVVEHDEEAIRSADHVLDLGPGAGIYGGKICASGTPADIIKAKNSVTADYLSGRKSIAVPTSRKKNNGQKLRIRGARGNNLRKVDADIPLGCLVAITGVSGSGKSTLINQTLAPAAAKKLNRSNSAYPADHDKIDGLEHLDKLVVIDQNPIGRTPRSNPATYTGLFSPLRELFASTREARSRGYKPGHFSFNVAGGRCEACKGDGTVRVEMHFLPDVYVPCEVCSGKRYRQDTLSVLWKGQSIADVLDMSIVEAAKLFDDIPTIVRRLQTLLDVGLGYLRLGQPATTLSGGEAQRIKLSRELSRVATGQTLYLLDEPTTGLHFADIALLLTVLQRLRDKGNSVLVIEHNLDVIKTADWIVDLGPEGGDGGGQIIAAGTPEKVAKTKGSHTGQFLRELL